MRDSGRADGDEIDGAEKVAPVCYGRHAMVSDGRAADFGACIRYGDQFDAFYVTIFGSVVTAKSAGTDHSRLKRPFLVNTEWGQSESRREYRDIRSGRPVQYDS